MGIGSHVLQGPRHALLDQFEAEIEGNTLNRKDARAVAVAIRVTSVMTGGDVHSHPRAVDENSKMGPNETILDWRNRAGKQNLAKSVVGTSQYMAPEIVRGETYDGRCGWWSIGTILYEVSTTMDSQSTVRRGLQAPGVSMAT